MGYSIPLMRLVVLSLMVMLIGIGVSMAWVARLAAWQAANVASARLVDRLGYNWDCNEEQLERLVGEVTVPMAMSRLPFTTGAGIPYIHAAPRAGPDGCVVETAVTVHWGARFLTGWAHQTAVVCRSTGLAVAPVPLTC